MMREGKLATGKRAAAMDTPHAVHADMRTPMRFQDMWFLEKLALFDRETNASYQTTHQTIQQKKVTKPGANASDS
ncbi:catalase [Pectobacterium aroidearum]|uniref:catalase n=2 Tax=Pectobacterium aroidearum TaxID=1201031 RepID=UPI00211457FC|nr:catalase [Pectobacterium aroidearum]UUE43948.1 catalase [Pectobacterium aroidearum]UUE48167.1 catalase [Pectobacterium aroidearum]UUE52372.1 catalase [Pectobacterium aroidearum]UUE60782.1 catalase [Pectobacterium aroidearum]UUE65004.1 catalase [Pectobacterium aroidearum]